MSENEQVFLIAGEPGQAAIVVDRHAVGDNPASDDEEPSSEGEEPEAKPDEGEAGDEGTADGEGEGGDEPDEDNSDGDDDSASKAGITPEAHKETLAQFLSKLDGISEETKGFISELSLEAVYEEGLAQLRSAAMIADGGPKATAEVLAGFAGRIAAHRQKVGDPSHIAEAFTPEEVTEKLLDDDSLSDFELKLVLTIQAVHERNVELRKLAFEGTAKVAEAIGRTISNQTDATILGSLSKAFPGESFDVKEVRNAMVQFGLPNPVHAVILSKAGQPRRTEVKPKSGIAWGTSGGRPTQTVITKAEQSKMSIGDLYLKLSAGAVLEE